MRLQFVKTLGFALLFFVFALQAIGQSDSVIVSGSTILCQGESVTLSPNTSYYTTPATFQWYNSNGTISGATNSNYVASSSGTYYVVVTSGNNSITFPSKIITVNPKPTANFSFSPNNIPCSNTPINFINTSTGATSYTWNFGDGNSGVNNSSNATSPTHTFIGTLGGGNQSFSVQLIATNSNGCKDVNTQNVTTKKLPDPILLDPINNFRFCGNSSSATLKVYDKSSPVTNANYLIKWGDATPDYSSTSFPATGVDHVYASGIYNITYTVTGSNGCTNSSNYAVYNITNPQIGAGIPANTQGCGPVTVCFPINNFSQNHSSTTYRVVFGDNSSDTTFNHPPPDSVCHTYTTTSCGQTNNSFTFKITAKNGCDSSVGQFSPVRVYTKPTAKFSVSPSTGCVNSVITFTNNTILGYNSSCNTSTIYTWDFGDNKPPITVFDKSSQTYTYTAAGTYKVTLTAQNSCGTTKDSLTICIGKPPTASFSTTAITGCAPLNIGTVNNSDTSLGCSSATYSWSISNYTATNCGTTSNAGFASGSNSSSINPSFTFTNPGTYTIRLSVTNSCNTSVTTQSIVVKRPPTVSIPTINNSCGPVTLTPSANVTNCGTDNLSYAWSFPSGSPISANTANPGSVSFNSSGSNSIKLVASNECGSDSAIRTFTINPKPTLTLPADQTFCSGQASGVQNFSSSLSGTIFNWSNNNTGIGLVASGTGSSFNSFNTTNTGSSPITGTISVTGTANGCASTSSYTITVNPNPTVTQPSNQTLCNDYTTSAINFTGSSVSGTTYVWTNNLTSIGLVANGTGDIAPFTAINTGASPVTATINVTPKYTNAGTTCSGPTKSFTITVNPSITNNNISANQTICAGATAGMLTQAIGTTLSGGNGSFNYQWLQSTNNGATWSIISGAINANYAPGTPSVTTQYRRLVTSNTCADSSNIITITIQGSLGNLGISSNQIICAGNTPQNIVGNTPSGGNGSFTYLWESSNDNVNWSQIAGANQKDYQPLALYQTTYYRRFVISGSCSSYSPSPVIITVNPLPEGNISAVATAICQTDAGKVTFTATKGTSPFAVEINASGPSGYSNNITKNNLLSGAQIEVIPVNQASGTYTITLTKITDNNGCVISNGFSGINITVKANPVLSVLVDTTICEGGQASLTVSGAMSYAWSPSNGLSSSTGASVTANPTSTTTYTVTGTTNGCTKTATVKVTVNPKPTAPVVTTPVTYCQNSVATALSATGTNLTWYTSSSLTGGTSTAPVPSTNASGSTAYYVTQKNSFACESNAAKIDVNVLPLIAGNSIGSSQVICSGGTPAQLTGTATVTGGQGSSYSYQWQVSVNNGASWTDISGAVNATYSPGALSSTTMYRRVVVSSACSDISNVVTITVQGLLTNNTLAANQTICSGTAPSAITGSVPSGGDGNYNYSWETSSDNIIWTLISGANGQNYSPSNLTADTYYRRIVKSGQCTNTSAAVKITVNPVPVVNTFNDFRLCHNSVINGLNFTASTTANTSYAWVNDNTSIGLAGSGTGNINPFTVVNNSNPKVPVMANIAVAATYNANGKACTGDSMRFKILVLPNITVSTIPDDSVCTGTTIPAFTPTHDAGVYAGTVDSYTVDFSWTVSGSGISLMNGSGFQIPSFTTTNTGNTPLEAVIKVTPRYKFQTQSGSTTCDGNAASYKIVVKPKPVVSSKTTTVCSDELFTVTPVQNPPQDIIPSNIRYSWSVPTMQSGLSGGIAESNKTAVSGKLTNITNTDKTAVYTVSPVAAGCSGNDFTLTVTVKPEPFVENIIKTVCNEENFTVTPQNGIPSSATIVPAGTTYSWSAPVVTGGITGGAAGSNATAITGKLTNTTASPQTATYAVTPKSGNCEGSPFTVTLTVNPSANVAFNPAGSQTICSGETSQKVMLSSTTSGVTLSWTSTTPAGISGALTSGNDSIPAQTLTNNTTAPVTVKYKAIASTGGSIACSGNNYEYAITVNPKPVLADTVITVCSGDDFSVSPALVPSNTTYSWGLPVSSNLTGMASGTNSTTINGNLINTTNTQQSAVYTVNPAAGSCTGNSFKLTVKVNPKPVLQAYTATICSGETFTITPTNGSPVAAVIVPANTTYSWAMPSVPSGISGAVAANNQNTISGTLVNTTNTVKTVVYTVTPKSGDAGNCTGESFTVTVQVKPKPSLVNRETTICTQDSFTVIPDNNTLNIVPANTLYSWSAPIVTGGISGGVSGVNQTAITGKLTQTTNTTQTATYSISTSADGCAGNNFTLTVNVNPRPVIPALFDTICSNTAFTITPPNVPTGTKYTWLAPTGTGFSGGSAQNTAQSSISQTLTNTTTNAVNAVYKVTPVSGACGGSEFDVTITINPSAGVAFSEGNQVICSGSKTKLVTLSSVSSNVNFNWISVANGIVNVTPSGNNEIPVQTLTNTTNAPLTAVYKAIATTTNGAACKGDTATYSITVYPVPVLNASPLNQTICSNATAVINLSTTVTGSSFAWNILSNPAITGASAGNGAVISQTLVNTSTTAQNQVYRAAAKFGAQSTNVYCVGDSVDITVAVNPTPGITLPPAQTICSGTAFNDVLLVSDVAGAVFSWSATATSGTTVTTTSKNNTTSIPGEVLYNSTSSLGTVTYAITPLTGSSSSACAGTTVFYKVNVNPSPKVSFNQANQVICSGSANTAVNLSSSTQGVTFSWQVNPNGVSGITQTSGTASVLPAVNLINNSNTPQDVVYTIKAITTGDTACSGTDTTYIITVNPIPVATATPTSATICSETATAISLTSNVSGTTFSWTVSANANISGAAAGNGNTISQTLKNLSNTPQTITYTITPKYENKGQACSGSPVTVTITVTPKARITNAVKEQTICSEAASLPVSFTSSTDNTTYTWTASTANNITGFPSSGSGDLGAYTLQNPNATKGSVVFTVIPEREGCNGEPFTYTIYVNPKPNVLLPNPAAQTICSATTSAAVSLNSDVAGTVFDWAATPSSTAVTGFTASQNNVVNILPQTITNSSNVAQTVTYIITPEANGCTGATASYVITVNPTPVLSLPPDTTICSGATSNVVNLSSSVANTVFNWTATPSSASVSGYTPSLQNVTNIPPQTLTNSSNTPEFVTYKVIPIASGPGVGGCPGASADYKITVNPRPVVQFSLSDTTICSGSTTTLVTLSSTTPNVTYSWTSVANGITGVEPGGSGIIPVQTLVNNTNAPITVTYTAKATTTGAAACEGLPNIYRITVNPIPVVTATPAVQAICTNGTTNIALSSNVAGTTFSYSYVATGGVTGASAGVGNTIQQTLVNNGVNPETVTYTITPTYTNNGISCSGNSITVVITVNPAATITNNPLQQQVCTGTSSAPVVFTSATAGATYSWTATATTGISGFTASGSGNLPAMQLNNSTGSQGAIYYTVMATANQCPGPATTYTIFVNPDALAKLNVKIDSACAPFTIDSTAVSPALFPARNSSYNWYANNVFYGNSTNSNPGYILQNAGDSVVIRMVAVSLYGCKNDSLEHRFYTIPKPVTSFVSDTVRCGPASISFTNTTPNIDWFTYFWNFGNGITFTGKQPPDVIFNPNPTYGDTVYTVTLSAFTKCDTVQFSRNIRIKSKPKAIFTPSKTYGCSPLTVDFANISKGLNVSYKWEFGDGASQLITGAAPVQHTYITAVQDTFTARLIAMNECGQDTMEYKIVVAPNTIKLDFAVNGNQYSGCNPHIVKFINNSSGATAFFWDFGDGNLLNTNKNIDTITHVYIKPGNYTVLLKATNGCTDTSSTELIKVFAKPIPDFAAQPLTVCIGDSIYFKNQTDTATGYLWNFGNGVTSTNTSPSYAYQQAGVYNVKLIAAIQYGPGNACSDSITKQVNVVSTLPGVLKVSDSISKCVPFTVTFTNQSLPSVITQWNFGDNTTATGDVVNHTYKQIGTYFVTMTAKDPGGCTYVDTITIKVNGPAGTLQYDNGYVCGNTPVRFEVSGTGIDSVRWDFGDGNTLTTNSTVVYHVYSKAGNYLPKAEMLSAWLCSVPLLGTDTIKVDYIKAGFKFSDNKICGSTAVQFSDTSRSHFGIAAYIWNFGDGNISAIKNPLHSYQTTNTYPVSLIVKGISGCSDTARINAAIKVNDIPVAAIVANTKACVDQPETFKALVNAVDSVSNYAWLFTGGISSTSAIFTTAFGTTGDYTIRLIAGTQYGCYDTVYSSITVNPTPFVKTNPDRLICKGKTYQLNATGALNYAWAPVTGLSCSTCSNPVASPQTTTEYIVTGTNGFGCSANDTVLITVAQPIKIQVSGEDTICIGQTTQLFVTGATTYSWSPSATLSSSVSAAPVVNTNVTTQYRVIGFDAHNCFQDTAFITVAVGKYPTVKLGVDTTLQTGVLYALTPAVTEGPIAKWKWLPATDLSCNDCPAPVAEIKNNVCYNVTATNIYGCSGSDTVCIKVFCENTQVFIPNAFTPDESLHNNHIFMVRGTGIKSVLSFRIFNRWGQLVFEKSNFPPNSPAYGWDGRVNGKAANPDVYVYTCEVVCENGVPYTYKGNVALIR